MLANLKAEMARRNIKPIDIAKVIGSTERTAKNKIERITDFSIFETVKIRDAFFQNMNIEYLFSPEEPKA